MGVLLVYYGGSFAVVVVMVPGKVIIGLEIHRCMASNIYGYSGDDPFAMRLARDVHTIVCVVSLASAGS